MRHPSSYGDAEITNIIVEKLLDRLDLSAEDKEIFVLRFGHNWYYKEIGEHVADACGGAGIIRDFESTGIPGLHQRL